MTKPAPDPITANFNAQSGLCISPSGFVALERNAPAAARDAFLADQLLTGGQELAAALRAGTTISPSCKDPMQVSTINIKPSQLGGPKR